MKRDFEFESDHFTTPDGQYCAIMRVHFEVESDSCSTPKGTQALQGFHITKIYDEDNRVYRNLEDFPQAEQTAILSKASALAEDEAYNAYVDENVAYIH